MMAQPWLKQFVVTLSNNPTPSEMCKIMSTISFQIRNQSTKAKEVLEHFFHPGATNILQQFLRTNDGEFLACTFQCIDETLISLLDAELSVSHLDAFEILGDTVLKMHYEQSKSLTLSVNHALILLSSLSILGKVAGRCPKFLRTHISEILGIAKANVNYGLHRGKENVQAPEKILPTENVPFDSSAEELEVETEPNIRVSGGKVPKKRKPRALAKSMQNPQNTNHQPFRFQILTPEDIVNDVRTSDSDASELENNASDDRLPVTSVQDRQRYAKIRFAAISLLGTIVTRLQERRILYGFWHAFFENTKIPFNGPQRQRTDLLYIGSHDPNSRCRSVALQIAGQLIFSSKSFLQQAECVEEHLPSPFLPFAHNLGLHVVSMFDELTLILETEPGNVAVLTQALKCLAVLVQTTTPFKKFQPRDFVGAFVKQVKRLLMHRDCTVQVAALMVLEFLVAAPELTPEIFTAIGALNDREQRLNNGITHGIIEIDNIFDEHLEDESDDVEAVSITKRNPHTIENNAESLTQRHSNWLLKQVLQNLGALSNGNENCSPTTIVRIESLQVLSAMSSHFHVIESNLEKIVIAIRNSISEDKNDLRLCAARCLDSISYMIGRTLLECTTKSNGTAIKNNDQKLEEICIDFWDHVLPIIYSQFRSNTSDSNSVKVCVCDALSNIGGFVFERQPHAVQMNLIGFLSGIASDLNEDPSVRCAAVRALAVYVSFPSLQGNLVFVENAAELTLRLLMESNFLVRVKASWALGNISDALLNSSSNVTQPTLPPERISGDLFWRLISAATEACNDNDKVRCNAVRILGNLLGLLVPIDLKSKSHKSLDYQILFQSAVIKLIDCLRGSGSAKVKWNTCYALGNLLQNETLFDSNFLHNNTNWQYKLFSALSNAIVYHQNFKVRINAATALTKVKNRLQFGSCYESLWKALLNAIERSNHLDNFYEYNHRDHLQEQLCLAICHMVCHAQNEDFLMIQKYIETFAVELSNTLPRVINRMVPEKSTPIVACAAYLHQKRINPNVNLTIEQRNAISSVIALFVK